MRRAIGTGIWLAGLCALTAACSQQKERPVDTTLDDPVDVAVAPVPMETALPLDAMGAPADDGVYGGEDSVEDGHAEQAGADAPAPAAMRDKPELLSRAFAADYPAAALREERQGRVEIILAVSTQGRVSDCEVAVSSGSADLDDSACGSALRRARYRPATDTTGAPIASTNVHETFNYKIN